MIPFRNPELYFSMVPCNQAEFHNFNKCIYKPEYSWIIIYLYNRAFIMAGGFIPESELKLTGIQKYYNSFTLRGRFNVSILSVQCSLQIKQYSVYEWDASFSIWINYHFDLYITLEYIFKIAHGCSAVLSFIVKLLLICSVISFYQTIIIFHKMHSVVWVKLIFYQKN